MKLGLGIDTGGTYTDAVIYDFDTDTILETAKVVTVHEDLTISINNILESLPHNTLKEVELVSLSTTLATNACVEGKGGRSVLVFIGCDSSTIYKHGHEYGLPADNDMIFLSGGHNLNGEVISVPDWDLLETEVLKYNNRADSFGIVQMWGMRNPEFEKEAKRRIMNLTGKPVVCAHELTGELNFMRRAASTLLNAQLIPLINDFIDAVKSSLARKSINAPLVIVRGDGSLMSEEFAREKPVETLLSGPAASIAGGVKLSGRKDCIIVDMGGTTSDLALVKDSQIRLAEDGATVGGWKTGTKSILIETVGLGGDSLISIDSNGNLSVGPLRAAPLSWLASRWPSVIDSIRGLYYSNVKHSRSLCEFYYLLKNISDNSDYSSEEVKIISALANGPLSITELAEKAGTSIYEIRTDRLEKQGVVMKSSLTPTDLMHVSGDFTGWNKEAAQLGAEIMARRLNTTVDDLVKDVFRIIKKKLFLNIVSLLINREYPDILPDTISKQLEDLIMIGYRNSEENNGYITCKFTTDLSLVGIGAPIHVFLSDVAKALNAQCVIPDNAPVANAVGAATGNVSVQEIVSIRPRYEVAGISGYDCHSSEVRCFFDDYSKALEWAKSEADRLARKNAAARGASDINIILDISENSAQLPGYEEQNRLHLETLITARAIGKLKWL